MLRAIPYFPLYLILALPIASQAYRTCAYIYQPKPDDEETIARGFGQLTHYSACFSSPPRHTSGLAWSYTDTGF